MRALRWVKADNPGPFTLDGTRTWIVGDRRLAVIDPGPDMDDHVRAVVREVGEAEAVAILLTHGHADHAGAVDRLADALGGASVFGAGHPRARPLPADGWGTDAGTLVALPTPGHTRDHLAFHWPERRALFAGDHLLGEGDTTWVAEYPGCVADYLRSLDRVRALDLAVVYSAHGPPLDDPADAVDRFERHRRARIAAVRAVRERHPTADLDRVYHEVYADTVPPGLEGAARRSLAAIVEYVDTGGGGGVSSPP